jgi:hypothetical protein
VSALEAYKVHFGGDLAPERAQDVVDQWAATVRTASGRDDVELAAPFQRHYLRLGTKLPPNFCLALTADEALFFKFDPRHGAHPLLVTTGQVKKQVAVAPRAEVRVTATEKGRLAIGVTFELPGGRTLPCRTPRLAVNPAAAAMITTLGGDLPV